MSDEPEIRIVKVPNYLKLHPKVIERYERKRAEMRRRMGDEAFARLEAVEAEATRCMIGGGS